MALTLAKVQGVQRLNRRLARLPDEAKKLIRSAMEASAKETVSMMKGLVSRDSGALANSIGWTWGDPPSGSVSIADLVGQDKSLTISIYAGDREAYYARFVEFGTIKMPAHPFFYVSWRANRKRAKARIARAINKSVKRAIK